jgi:sec-independent protein translocase protein TatA
MLGGKKIPELARSVGKGVSEFKKGIRDVEHDAMTEMVNKQQTVAQPPAPVAAPVASQPAETQQFRFDPYTGKPLTNDTAKA